MRAIVLPALLAQLALSAASGAQDRALTTADSVLIGRILLAEDRRDAHDDALSAGARHGDARVRMLARRARARTGDSLFVGRDSFPALAAPVAWPDVEWRARLRSVSAQKSDCAVLRAALADSAWPVRLVATDLVASPCSADGALADTLRAWVDALPADASRRQAGGVSWHGAAHGFVALARIRPAEARSRMGVLVAHRQWQVRMYAARAAAVLLDTLQLRTLARDRDDNVREAAIEALSKLVGHDADDIYLSALTGQGAQAVRAAAIALTGSSRTDARAAALLTFERWVARGNAPARDARVALLAAAGRAASDDRAPAPVVELLPNAVALALGEDVRLLVTMAPGSGGGSFTVRLRGDVAPVMASRILALVRARYYDGLTWQRVEHDFVIQGGSPGANEYVGLPAFLRDELGTVPHVRGTVGMSTRGHDTGDAQWFINLKDNLRLGRDYTVFGEVVRGIGVVDGILEGDTIASIEEVPAPSR